MKGNNGKELCKLHVSDPCKQHIRAIELSDHVDVEMFLTIVMELKMDKVMRLKWTEYSNDSQTTLPVCRLVKFFDIQARHFESVTSDRKPLTITHMSYTATVEREYMPCEKEETIHWEPAVSSKVLH